MIDVFFALLYLYFISLHMFFVYYSFSHYCTLLFPLFSSSRYVLHAGSCSCLAYDLMIDRIYQQGHGPVGGYLE